MTNNRDILSLALFISVLVHTIIILCVNFELPEIVKLANTDNTLDIVLINQSNNEEPEEAETVSTQNNLGGGDANKEASSPLDWKIVDPNEFPTLTKVAKQHDKNNKQTTQIVYGDGLKISASKPEDINLKNQNSKISSDNITINNKHQLEQKRLIAKLQEQLNEYQKRPHREYLSPTTKQHNAAQYVDNWRKKVEDMGNANYPQQAKAKALSGTLIIDVALNQNGTIFAINLLKPSEHKLLNDAAVRFIRDAAPYSEFSDELKKEFKVIHITRAFHFRGNRYLSTSDAAGFL